MAMYKVLIVDDEKQITDGLCRMIKWAEMGFEVAATARDGAEAIPLIQALRPNLVVTDVRMPQMDGLRMLEHVRRHFSQDIEFIILSGFSDFQYAQKALQYKVKSYILKPIDEAELYGALLDIKAQLDEKEIRENLLIKHSLNDYLSGRSDSGGAFPPDEEQQGLRYLVIERHEQFASLSASPEPQSQDLFETLTGVLGAHYMRFVLRQDRDRCQLVAGKSLLSLHHNNPRCLARALQDGLRAAGIDADILVGAPVPGSRELYQSVQSVSRCRSKLFYLNKPSVVIHDDILEETFCKVYQDNGLGVKIIAAFRKNDMEKLQTCVTQLAEHFTGLQVAPEIALIHLDSAMASILQILSENAQDSESVLEQYALFKKIQNRVGMQNLARLAVQFCQACNRISIAGKKAEHGDVVAKVARYVEENYARPLKINDIAEHFYVNPAYLGQQFARKKGCSLNHYINSIRIEQAKGLLAYSNRRIYEVALETGFDDPNYFSSKFLEYTGTTPSEYRSQHGAESGGRSSQ